MTPEEQEKLTNMATLYDSLSPTLKQIFVSQIGYGETIQNTSNASSHIDVLKEEIEEMVSLAKDGVIENNVKTFVDDNEVFLFRIKINDSFCEWEFGLPISNEACIEDIVLAIEDKFEAKRTYERLILDNNGKKVQSL